MRAIDNVRRDLASKAWLQHSQGAFAGALHDFKTPMAKRLASRQHTGPYYFSPAKPGTGRGFYQSSDYMACGDSTFDLRLDYANTHLRGFRFARVEAYWCDEDGSTTLTPIVARLPHGRGFLAGWSMGKGMLANIDSTIYRDIEDAAMAAHDMAESDAEKERDAAQNETDSEDGED